MATPCTNAPETKHKPQVLLDPRIPELIGPDCAEALSTLTNQVEKYGGQVFIKGSLAQCLQEPTSQWKPDDVDLFVTGINSGQINKILNAMTVFVPQLSGRSIPHQSKSRSGLIHTSIFLDESYNDQVREIWVSFYTDKYATDNPESSKQSIGPLLQLKGNTLQEIQVTSSLESFISKDWWDNFQIERKTPQEFLNTLSQILNRIKIIGRCSKEVLKKNNFMTSREEQRIASAMKELFTDLDLTILEKADNNITALWNRIIGNLRVENQQEQQHIYGLLRNVIFYLYPITSAFSNYPIFYRSEPIKHPLETTHCYIAEEVGNAPLTDIWNELDRIRGAYSIVRKWARGSSFKEVYLMQYLLENTFPRRLVEYWGRAQKYNSYDLPFAPTPTPLYSARSLLGFIVAYEITSPNLIPNLQDLTGWRYREYMEFVRRAWDYEHPNHFIHKDPGVFIAK